LPAPRIAQSCGPRANRHPAWRGANEAAGVWNCAYLGHRRASEIDQNGLLRCLRTRPNWCTRTEYQRRKFFPFPPRTGLAPVALTPRWWWWPLQSRTGQVSASPGLARSAAARASLRSGDSSPFFPPAVQLWFACGARRSRQSLNCTALCAGLRRSAPFFQQSNHGPMSWLAHSPPWARLATGIASTTINNAARGSGKPSYASRCSRARSVNSVPAGAPGLPGREFSTWQSRVAGPVRPAPLPPASLPPPASPEALRAAGGISTNGSFHARRRTPNAGSRWSDNAAADKEDLYHQKTPPR